MQSLSLHLTFTGWRPRTRIQRAHDRALAMAMALPWPTGRGRMPGGPRPAVARDRGVFSEMAPRNRSLGDGGAGQVHGPAWVRLERESGSSFQLPVPQK